jgi:hypothetical protein
MDAVFLANGNKEFHDQFSPMEIIIFQQSFNWDNYLKMNWNEKEKKSSALSFGRQSPSPDPGRDPLTALARSLLAPLPARRAMAPRASSGSSNRPLTPGNLPTGPPVRPGQLPARRRSDGFEHLPLSLNNATCHLLHLHSERSREWLWFDTTSVLGSTSDPRRLLSWADEWLRIWDWLELMRAATPRTPSTQLMCARSRAGSRLSRPVKLPLPLRSTAAPFPRPTSLSGHALPVREEASDDIGARKNIQEDFVLNCHQIGSGIFWDASVNNIWTPSSMIHGCWLAKCEGSVCKGDVWAPASRLKPSTTPKAPLYCQCTAVPPVDTKVHTRSCRICYLFN